jgi:hypothetical protein
LKVTGTVAKKPMTLEVAADDPVSLQNTRYI